MPVAVLSDTFEQIARPLMPKLGRPMLICHSLTLDDDRVVGYELRIADQKARTVAALQSLNYRVVAAGDSYNDTSMLAKAHTGVLFRAPGNVRAEYPEFPVLHGVRGAAPAPSGRLLTGPAEEGERGNPVTVGQTAPRHRGGERAGALPGCKAPRGRQRDTRLAELAWHPPTAGRGRLTWPSAGRARTRPRRGRRSRCQAHLLIRGHNRRGRSYFQHEAARAEPGRRQPGAALRAQFQRAHHLTVDDQVDQSDAGLRRIEDRNAGDIVVEPGAVFAMACRLDGRRGGFHRQQPMPGGGVGGDGGSSAGDPQTPPPRALRGDSRCTVAAGRPSRRRRPLAADAPSSPDATDDALRRRMDCRHRNRRARHGLPTLSGDTGASAADPATLMTETATGTPSDVVPPMRQTGSRDSSACPGRALVLSSGSGHTTRDRTTAVKPSSPAQTALALKVHERCAARRDGQLYRGYLDVGPVRDDLHIDLGVLIREGLAIAIVSRRPAPADAIGIIHSGAGAETAAAMRAPRPATGPSTS